MSLLLFEQRMKDYFAKNLPSKFVVEDSTLLSFVAEHHLMLQAPDSYDYGERKGVAVAYFLHQGIIPPSLEHIDILKPYYHELYMPYGVGKTSATGNSDLEHFIADLDKSGITGVVATIPIRPTYDEIMAAWRKELESLPKSYTRARRVAASA